MRRSRVKWQWRLDHIGVAIFFQIMLRTHNHDKLIDYAWSEIKIYCIINVENLLTYYTIPLAIGLSVLSEPVMQLNDNFFKYI